MQKPQQIIELENILDFELEEVDKYDILDDKKVKTYCLNSKNEVIGLNLYGCNLDGISFLSKLQELEFLYLKNNKITNISSIYNLKNLNTIYVNHNQIQEIILENFPLLNSLEVSENPLENIILRNIPNLRYLHLKNLNLEKVTIENLINLIILTLDFNRISEFNFKKLNKLERLFLDSNFLNSIAFVKKISNLPKLNFLSLYGNPLQNIPTELLGKGIYDNCLEAVRNYLESVAKVEDRQELNEAKLIFVGRGMVGKTELADALSEENYIFNPKRPMTEGIRIKTWQPIIEKNNKNVPFNINIWDFAGQEISYGTHQFFLTKSSLYVLVWRWRVDDPANRFSLEYWLNIIKLLSDSSPVLVVQNWVDEDGAKRIPEYQWKELFPNIVGFYQTSCKDGKGVKELATEIHKQITKLPHTSETWNKNRVALRKSLEQSTENYISYSDYLKMAEKHEIDKNSAKFLSEQLHKLGVILHFRNDIRFEDTIILKPEWATQAAYKLIDEKINPNGRFRIAELKEYWKEEIYDGKHLYLLNLMLRFYLIFNISRTDEYIVPDLLPENPPENLPIFPQDNRLIFEYHYSFMPKSLLTHFICLNASYIQGNCLWKNGVFLQQNGSKARIIGSELSNYIRLEVSGHHSDEFLTILRGFVQTVHKDILDEEPVFREVIPCPCEKCANQEEYFDRHFFDYQSLKELKLEGEQNIRCSKNVKAKFSIDYLLTGIEPLKSKEDLILENQREMKAKLENIKVDTSQILQIFTQEFSQLKQNFALQEEERFRLLGELIDRQKPQNLDFYAQKAKNNFPKFDILQADSQNFMAMAFYFLEILPDNGDFSPVALQFCRALELEMKTVFKNFKISTFKTLPNYPTQNNETYKHFQNFVDVDENKITLGQMLNVIDKAITSPTLSY